MSINKITFGILMVIVSLKSDFAKAQIPLIPFPEVVINLNFPEFASLRIDGGYKEISYGGIKGIIIYRVNTSTYTAFDRMCPMQPDDSCSKVEVHSSGLYLTDPGCESTFNFSDGNPSGGPASWPLRQYRTTLTGSSLTISDEPIN